MVISMMRMGSAALCRCHSFDFVISQTFSGVWPEVERGLRKAGVKLLSVMQTEEGKREGGEGGKEQHHSVAVVVVGGSDDRDSQIHCPSDGGNALQMYIELEQGVDMARDLGPGSR